MCSVANGDNTSEWNFFPYHVISIWLCPLRSVNLCLCLCPGKVNLIYCYISFRYQGTAYPIVNLLNIINYLSFSGRECKMLIRLCGLLFFFFFGNEERKDDLVRYPGEFFPLLVKENYSLHSLREKSIIPNKSQSCCPFSAVLSRTQGNVDSVSYGFSVVSFFLFLFFF